MASASTFLTKNQFLCCICLDVFTDPVSLLCGHNFCKACLSRLWADANPCKCPLCKETFNRGLKLCINIELRDIVENFKTHLVIAENSEFKPGQMPCDCCLGNKSQASKTCLVCLASFCETHLEPHRRTAAFKRHKLTNPVHNLEEKICKKHSRIFELFCRDDQTSVCVLCTEHSAHDTVPLDENYVDKGVQMRKKNMDAQRAKHGKEAQTTKAVVQRNNKEKCEASAKTVKDNWTLKPHFTWFPEKGPYHVSGFSRILINRSLSKGRLCYEVVAESKISWVLGVVPVSEQRMLLLNPTNKAWIMKVNNSCSCQSCRSITAMRTQHDRVIVCIDYQKRCCSFYDANSESLLWSCSCKTNERLFLMFSPVICEVSWSQRLRQKFQEITQDRDALFLFFLFILFFFWGGWVCNALG
ncbi:uncharacterized protein KZ484_025983 [Pholidichthys leucotaenia]